MPEMRRSIGAEVIDVVVMMYSNFVDVEIDGRSKMVDQQRLYRFRCISTPLCKLLLEGLQVILRLCLGEGDRRGMGRPD